MRKILENMIESANALHEASVMDEVTMREFEALSLLPVKEYTPAQIKRIRVKNRVSRPAFAAFLNVSASTVKAWEYGETHPKRPAIKLLEIVERKGLRVLVAR